MEATLEPVSETGTIEIQDIQQITDEQVLLIMERAIAESREEMQESPSPIQLHDKRAERIPVMSLQEASRVTAKLYEEYAEDVRKYSAKFIGYSHCIDADDITQKTFLRIMEHIRMNGIRQEIKKGWVIRISYNILMDFYRSQGKHNVLSIENMTELNELDEIEAQDTGAEKSVEDLELLQKSLHAMSPRQRMVVFAYALFPEHTYEQIGMDRHIRLWRKYLGEARKIIQQVYNEV